MDQGTTFHFVLKLGVGAVAAPLLAPTDSPAPPQYSKTSQVSARSLHILLAEDQPVNQLLAVRILEKRGHSVMVANNGEEALELLARESFHLVLMDVQMPKMDGFETTRTIRLQEKSSGQHVPIIAMTAYAIKGDRERCLKAGFDEYLSKPIASLSLYAMVEKMLRSAAPSLGSISEIPAKPPESDVAIPVWDRSAALARVDGDEGFLRELAALFVENCPRLLAQLAAAIQDLDPIAIAKAAHTIQGNVASLNATASYEQTRLLEEKAKVSELEDIEPLQAELQRRLDAFVEILKRFIAEAGSSHLSELVLAGGDQVSSAR